MYIHANMHSVYILISTPLIIMYYLVQHRHTSDTMSYIMIHWFIWYMHVVVTSANSMKRVGCCYGGMDVDKIEDQCQSSIFDIRYQNLRSMVDVDHRSSTSTVSASRAPPHARRRHCRALLVCPRVGSGTAAPVPQRTGWISQRKCSKQSISQLFSHHQMGPLLPLKGLVAAVLPKARPPVKVIQ